MAATGYAGRIMEIDLTIPSCQAVGLEEKFCRDYLGGIGFNARIIYDGVPVGADPLGKENILVFSAGTMVGSTFPTASRTEASAKSPMTGLFGTSNSGMFFGTQLKNAGFDSLVIKGQADTPVYLYIEAGQAEVRDGTDLWGKDSWETIDTLKKLHPGCEVACIGPAGENLVRFACIENSYFDAWARTGLGAVMGSKRLKAVVVRGTLGIKPYSAEKLIEISWKARQLIESSPFFGPFKSYGSMNAAIPYGNFKALNAHNFSQGCLPDWKENFARGRVEQHTTGHIACQSCIIACAHWVEIKEGKYKGLRMKDMEVTPTVSFGSGCGMSLEGSVKACEMSQRYGFDMVSVGGVIAMAIEMYNRGIIAKEEIGYELTFGDDDAILRLMDDIAHRRGLGEVLAEGVMRASQKYEQGASSAMHVKGLEMPMIDPRGRISTWSMGILTNIRGGDHLRCRNPIENLRYNENKQLGKERFGFDARMYEALDMPADLKAQAIDLDDDTTDIAVMSYWAENLINLFNSLGVCIRPPVEHRIGPTILTEAFTAFTGIPMDPDQLMRAAERSWNLMKLFNLREGEKPEDSQFPSRFYQEEVGGRKLDQVQMQELLRHYYLVRGWEPGTGIPTPAKLKELGLDTD